MSHVLVYTRAQADSISHDVHCRPIYLSRSDNNGGRCYSSNRPGRSVVYNDLPGFLFHVGHLKAFPYDPAVGQTVKYRCQQVIIIGP